MGTVIGDILPVAVGVAVSPVPVIALILMLFSKRARSNGPAFAFGWVAGIAAVGAIVLAVSGASDVATESGPSTVASVVQLVLGLLLLLLAARQWRGRPGPGEEAATPKWMQGIEGFTPVKAAGIAIVLAGVNPKNLLLIVGASVTIAQAGLSAGETTVAFAVFTLLASVTVLVPVVAYLALGDRAARALEEIKAWLSANNAAVMAVLLLVFGAVLLGKGIGGLTS
jgi:threonine/homoserine/homoserine lactone efflux protein